MLTFGGQMVKHKSVVARSLTASQLSRADKSLIARPNGKRPTPRATLGHL